MTPSRCGQMPEGLSHLAIELAQKSGSTLGLLFIKGPRRTKKRKQKRPLKSGHCCILTCFKLAFHKLCLGSLSTVKKPALALTPKDQSRGTPGWGRVRGTCAQKCHIHRHVYPVTERSPGVNIPAPNHQPQVP